MQEALSRSDLVRRFRDNSYVLDNELSTIIFLMSKLNRPILLEGNPGVGKTAIAATLAKVFETNLIRLQCYEGLDVNSAVYEWNYQKQLLAIKLQEGSDLTTAEKEAHIFHDDFLLKRPLLQAITQGKRPPVLLIDEVDRADEEFEAYLLELLSEFQISIPELGTIRADARPLVVLTSNRTRELSDALKRRCLYHWVEYPDKQKELQIVRMHRPDIDSRLAVQIVDAVHAIRQLKLSRTPGIAETLDWAMALDALSYAEVNSEVIQQTLGCLVKTSDDMEKLLQADLERLASASTE